MLLTIYCLSDVVLEDRPWPRESSRTKNHVLGLESSGLESHGLDLGICLKGPGLDYEHVNFTLWDASRQCVLPSF